MNPKSRLPFYFEGILRVDWAHLRAARSLPCAAAVAACLFGGLALGNAPAGMVAAGGAMSVGFGSFQWLGRSRVAPMLWATLGMSVSAVGGSLVGHSGPGAILNAAWAGFGGGLLLALGPGSSWVGQQCAIVAIVASGYPAGTDVAVSRALLILAGGALQTGMTLTLWRWRAPSDEPPKEEIYEGAGWAVRTLWANLTPASEAFRYAVRQGATLAVAAACEHFTGLANGYWVPMTALLVIKPDFKGTFHRGVERTVGTLIGAALATLLVHELRLEPVTVGLLTVLFAYGGYALVNVNYAIFAVCLTSYIVFLLDFGGLSTKVVVAHRTINTALGGGLALLSYVTVLIHGWRGEPDPLQAMTASEESGRESTGLTSASAFRSSTPGSPRPRRRSGP